MPFAAQSELVLVGHGFDQRADVGEKSELAVVEQVAHGVADWVEAEGFAGLGPSGHFDGQQLGSVEGHHPAHLAGSDVG